MVGSVVASNSSSFKYLYPNGFAGAPSQDINSSALPLYHTHQTAASSGSALSASSTFNGNIAISAIWPDTPKSINEAPLPLPLPLPPPPPPPSSMSQSGGLSSSELPLPPLRSLTCPSHDDPTTSRPFSMKLAQSLLPDTGHMGEARVSGVNNFSLVYPGLMTASSPDAGSSTLTRNCCKTQQLARLFEETATAIH
ncbi:unnamed protein product [Protopolystoma xenopodis]|uniref:Uncharacterized protein n=1 Tax=Protopolystoma xenopodis TaxID=117903 RepID=A0A3S5AL66_9PLAT|nr:unnamed protein product [Protopolystoma xenopodis]